jgi:glucokinase
MNYIIGVDIGGTKVAIGLVNKNGSLVKQEVLPTNLKIQPEEMTQRIMESIKRVLKDTHVSISDVGGLGIGAPGPLNSKKGLIVNPPNMPDWQDVPIVSIMEKEFSIPVRLENDANAAALAERWIGAGKNTDNFIYMTISTGIGAGIFSGGRLLTGATGNTGEVGHMVVDPSYGYCTCGQKGCFEWVASGTAISRLGSELAREDLTSEEVFHRYFRGDSHFKELINNVYTNIGAGCATLINLFDPDKIIIGGGVSKVGEPMFSAIRKYVKEKALSPYGKEVEIIPSDLKQNNGVIGAASLFRESLVKERNERIETA